MEQVILVVHLLIALALVGVILLQKSDGGALGGLGGGMGGGGGASFGGLFTARGGASFLTRTTAILAASFIATSLLLAILATGREEGSSVLDEMPAEQPAAPRPAAPEAEAPAVLARPDGGRLLVFAAALPSSGVPRSWAARRDRPGVAWLEDLAPASLDAFAARIAAARRADDTVVASLHWGPNWGYDVTAGERAFARGLIDLAGVDVVHGHSSHHPRAVEIHRGKPILYGAGDLLNDYEGIAGAEAYRGDLVLIYVVTLAGAGHPCAAFDLLPFRLRRFTLTHPDEADLVWLERRLNREYARFGGGVVRRGDDGFELRWS